MDIIKHLSSLEISEDNEANIRQFLDVNEVRIKDHILNLWNTYNESSLPRAEIIPIVNADLDDCNNLSDNSVISSDATAKEPEVGDDPINDTQAGQTIVLKEIEPSADNKSNDNFSTQLKSRTIILPNGKANQEYRHLFNIDDLGLAEIGEYWFEGHENLGLIFNPSSKELSGIPLVPGNHKIKIKIKRNDWIQGKPVFEREISLIINPDPKTLWKNIPTPIDIEYYKPDFDKSFVKVPSGKRMFSFGKSNKKDMVAASQRGRSHAQEGKPRDDDFALYHLKEEDWYIMAVADGAGSAKFSRKGSEIACKTIVDVCGQQIKNNHKEFESHIKNFSANKTEDKRKKIGDSLYGIIGNAVFRSVKNIEEEAKQTNRPIKDFSTTLIVSICKKFNFGWFVGAFWVGDGGIGIYNKETKFLKVLGESDGGEFAGQTRFLTMSEITQPTELYRRLRFDIVDDFTSLILMTDGITDPKFETDANLLKVEKWDELWAELSGKIDFSDDNEGAADQLLSWLDFWSPGNHDDRTIAILF